MTDSAAFKATYSDWKLIRTRKVVQVVLEVPVEQADMAYQVLGGMPLSGEEVWVGVARLNDESEVVPSAKSKQPTDTPPASAPEQSSARAPKRLVQQAAIACNDPLFQKYLAHRLPNQWKIMNCGTDSERAALAVRVYCAVKSRKEILPGTTAAEKWDSLYSQFTAWKLVA